MANALQKAHWKCGEKDMTGLRDDESRDDEVFDAEMMQDLKTCPYTLVCVIDDNELKRSNQAVNRALDWIYNNLYDEMVTYCTAKGVEETNADEIVQSTLVVEARNVMETFVCTLDVCRGSCQECTGEAIQRWLFSTLRIKVKAFFREFSDKRSKEIPWDFREVALRDEMAQKAIDEIEYPEIEKSDDRNEGLQPSNEEIISGELFSADSNREIDLILYRAIKLLPKRERQYIIARYFHGAESSWEVATLLGITELNARQIKHRALKRLGKNKELIAALRKANSI